MIIAKNTKRSAQKYGIVFVYSYTCLLKLFQNKGKTLKNREGDYASNN